MSDWLLDTNILIKLLRRDRKAADLVTELNQSGHVYISTVTRTEILAGMQAREEERTTELLNSLVNTAVEVAIADQAGRWLYQYARRGFQLAFPDALIAATALQRNLILVTTNGKHFPMADLKLRPVQQ